MSEHRLVIASDQALVAEAVRAAMSSHGFDPVVLPWGKPPSRRDGPEPPLLGLMIADLESLSKLYAGQDLVSVTEGRWLLLTATPKGPAWGAMLESGVRVILPSGTTLGETIDVLDRLAEGEDVGDDAERQALVERWVTERADREQLLTRIESLTHRERTVLRLLFAGDNVRTIAGRLAVSEATVRSHVRSLLRKMGVNSQMAAVAAFGWLQGEQPRHP